MCSDSGLQPALCFGRANRNVCWKEDLTAVLPSGEGHRHFWAHSRKWRRAAPNGRLGKGDSSR